MGQIKVEYHLHEFSRRQVKLEHRCVSSMVIGARRLDCTKANEKRTSGAILENATSHAQNGKYDAYMCRLCGRMGPHKQQVHIFPTFFQIPKDHGTKCPHHGFGDPGTHSIDLEID